MTEKTEKQSKKEIVVPGEVIAKGDDFLPGDWTVKEGDNIVAIRLGVLEKNDRLIKVIPLSGVYIPRRGNVVIGEIVDMNYSGWGVDIGGPYGSFLTLKEIPGYVEEGEMESVYGIGDLIVAKIFNVKRTAVDLTMKSREGELGKIKDGIIIRVNPHRVPRIIGKEGSMIKLIKEYTNCTITVGQNGLVWIKGDNPENKLFARRAIEFIVEHTTSEGLTDKVEKFLKENGGAKK
ncbi:MAG: exosome complex RNA-binding protein Rrp4 [archaeon]|nr:exosome complex RNA-binding protein Rrp4 [archaeon]